MLKGAGFEILIASLPDHDAVVAEIYFSGRFVALVSRDRADGAFELEFPGPNMVEGEMTRKVEVSGFQNVLNAAVARLQKAN